jgi:predicted enzyme related to lactoylglutathione lyase
MANRVVHFELPGDEPEKLVQFYSDLLGWKIEKAPTPGFDYWMCKTGEGPGIDGGIMRRLDPKQTLTNYVSVDQIDSSVAKAQALGAIVVVTKKAVVGAGWFSVVIDPQGNPLGFWQEDKGAR